MRSTAEIERDMVEAVRQEWLRQAAAFHARQLSLDADRDWRSAGTRLAELQQEFDEAIRAEAKEGEAHEPSR